MPAGEAMSTRPPWTGARAQASAVALTRGRFGPVVRLRRVASTHDLVVEAARRGTPEGLVVLAEEQLAGRGRGSRRFIAPPGGSLLCSVLLRPTLEASALWQCASALSLAALAACRRVGARDVHLKWPNDLVTPAGKLAGVLAELVDGAVPAVVVGMGCNCSWPEGWPRNEEDARLVAQASTLSAAVGRDVGPEELFAAFLPELEAAYGQLLAPGGVAATHAAWKAACTSI